MGNLFDLLEGREPEPREYVKDWQYGTVCGKCFRKIPPGDYGYWGINVKICKVCYKRGVRLV